MKILNFLRPKPTIGIVTHKFSNQHHEALSYCKVKHIRYTLYWAAYVEDSIKGDEYRTRYHREMHEMCSHGYDILLCVRQLPPGWNVAELIRFLRLTITLYTPHVTIQFLNEWNADWDVIQPYKMACVLNALMTLRQELNVKICMGSVTSIKRDSAFRLTLDYKPFFDIASFHGYQGDPRYPESRVKEINGEYAEGIRLLKDHQYNTPLWCTETALAVHGAPKQEWTKNILRTKPSRVYIYNLYDNVTHALFTSEWKPTKYADWIRNR